MAKKRVAAEFGMGSSLRREDYTEAASRALRDALWHNSLNIADAFGFDKSEMIVDIEIACQNPDAVDRAKIAEILPYGRGSCTVTKGGLDIPRPNGGNTVIAHAAVIVSFDMEPTT